MGLQLPERSAATRRTRRVGLAVLLGLTFVLIAGCGSDSQGERLGMPKPLTEEGEHTLDLWQGAWIAALATGVVVWGLIFYAIIKFRRRHEDEVPVQTRYNLPLEIFYTIFPIIMVIVFFDHTISTQNAVLNNPDDKVDNTIYVVGQQWQWTFNYPDEVMKDGKSVNVYEVGTASDIPTLHMPVDETTRFELRSPDVIHDFGIPGFLIKMDVIPGQKNHYQVTPKEIGGPYKGLCYELCGVYHSRMVFNVVVESRADYEAYLESLAEAGDFSDEPICGGKFAGTQVGLDETDSDEGICSDDNG